MEVRRSGDDGGSGLEWYDKEYWVASMDWKDRVVETLDTETMLVGWAGLTYTVRLAAYDRVGNACQVEKAVQVLEMLKEERVSVHGKP